MTETRPGAAPHIRTANKAIILDDNGRMLVNVMQEKETGTVFYAPPGGGQDHGEDRITALRRECREEIGCDVIVVGLACLRTYVGANHAFASWDGWFHQEEAYWFCRLPADAVPAPGDEPDNLQVGVAWKTFDELRAVHPEDADPVDRGLPVFAPTALLDWLETPPESRELYLGDTV